MVDQNRRKTIKLITGAGAVTISGATIGGAFGTAMAGITAGADATTTADSPLYSNGLKIQVIASSASEDTIVFVNNTSNTIVVKEFLPAYLTFENQMLDLNQLCRNSELTIKPGSPIAIKLASWEVLDLKPTSSYLWADSSAMRVKTPHTTELTINAAVVNGQALLTLDTFPENHDAIAAIS